MIEARFLIPISEQIITCQISQNENLMDDGQLIYPQFAFCVLYLNRIPETSSNCESLAEEQLWDEFFEACKNGEINKVSDFLINNQDLATSYSEDGLTALHYAALSENIHLINVLFQYSVDVNQTSKDNKLSALHIACLQGHLGVTDRILRHKDINVDLETEINSTPLHCACLKGCYEIVELLLQAKANYSIENSFGKTPIEMTCNKEIKNLMSKYMGTTLELPGSFEGKLRIPKFIGNKRVWGVLKPEEGEFVIFKENNHELLERLNLDDFQEVKRKKVGFLHKDFKFIIKLKSGTKEVFSAQTENDANEWTRNIFAALLYRQNKARAQKTAHFLSLEEFPVTSGVNYFSFEVETKLGSSDFSDVYLVRKIDTGMTYAMKSVLKANLNKQDYTKYAVSEAKILRKISFPFINKLEYSFQSERCLYLILEFCPNSTLADYLKNHCCVSASVARI